MIIQNNHQADISKSLYCMVEYLHSRLANQFWVSFQIFGWNRLIIVKHLKRVGESNAIHLEFVSDVHRDISQWPTL